MVARLRQVLAGRYRMLEREAAKIALDLKMARLRSLETLSAEAATQEQEYSRSQQEGYRTEAELTDARKRLAELKLELRAYTRAAGLSGQADRRPSSSGSRRAKRNRRSWSGVWPLHARNSSRHQAALAELEQQAR